jgi:hypothetical protein
MLEKESQETHSSWLGTLYVADNDVYANHVLEPSRLAAASCMSSYFRFNCCLFCPYRTLRRKRQESVAVSKLLVSPTVKLAGPQSRPAEDKKIHGVHRALRYLPADFEDVEPLGQIQFMHGETYRQTISFLGM